MSTGCGSFLPWMGCDRMEQEYALLSLVSAWKSGRHCNAFVLLSYLFFAKREQWKGRNVYVRHDNPDLWPPGCHHRAGLRCDQDTHSLRDLPHVGWIAAGLHSWPAQGRA